MLLSFCWTLSRASSGASLQECAESEAESRDGNCSAPVSGKGTLLRTLPEWCNADRGLWLT